MRKNKKIKLNDDFNESKYIKQHSKKIWKLLGSAALVLLLIIIVACIISIYNFFYKIHPYVGYGVLGLIILLMIIFIIRPLIISFANPCFTLDIVNETNISSLKQKNYRKLKRVANNIIKNNKNVSDESKEKIKKSLNSYNELNSVLKHVYDTEIKQDINKLVIERSAEVLISTAISQEEKFDALIVILTNIRMIMQIVVRCGYYPSYIQLGKLIVNVLGNALISYTVQASNFSDVIVGAINKLLKGALDSLPVFKKIASSGIDGASNALLTLRVGILTRKYLYEEYNIHEYILNKEEVNTKLLEEAINESNDQIDSVIASAKNK